MSLPFAALGQSARNVAMGGVITPDAEGMAVNPAYAHPSFQSSHLSVSAPVGLVIFMQELLKWGSDDFDLLYMLEYSTQPFSYILNPASGIRGIELTIQEVNGRPCPVLDVEGALPTGIAKSLKRGVGDDIELPFFFKVGDVQLGIRPFARFYMQIDPTASFDLFEGEIDTNIGLNTLSLKSAGGLSVDVLRSWEVARWSSPQTDKEQQFFVGGRVAPFLGLGKFDANLDEANIQATASLSSAEVSYTLDGASFVSVPFVDGGLGFGLENDLGVALRLPLDTHETLTFGFSFHRLNIEHWIGTEATVKAQGNTTDNTFTSDLTTSSQSKTLFAPHWSAHGNIAYQHTWDDMHLLIAADVVYDAITTSLSSHLGTEVTLANNIMLRAGTGYDQGWHWGLGAGIDLGTVTLDGALHSYNSLLLDHHNYALVLSTSFLF